MVQCVVKIIMAVRVPMKAGNFLTTAVTISFQEGMCPMELAMNYLVIW
jgi:hypothetical protein